MSIGVRWRSFFCRLRKFTAPPARSRNNPFPSSPRGGSRNHTQMKIKRKSTILHQREDYGWDNECSCFLLEADIYAIVTTAVPPRLRTWCEIGVTQEDCVPRVSRSHLNHTSGNYKRRLPLHEYTKQESLFDIKEETANWNIQTKICP